MTRSGRTSELAILHVGFVVTGAGTALLGPVLPLISARLHLGDVQAGRLFTAQFLGSFVVALASSAVIRALGTKGAVLCAFAAMAVGFAAAEFASWPMLLCCVLIYGAGLGLSNPAATLATASLRRQSSAPIINSVNFAWCAGALLAPAFLPLLRAPFAITAAAAGLVFATAAVTLRAEAPTREKAARHLPGLAALTCALLFLYVGTETTLAGWAPTWASRMGASRDSIGAPAACFWAGILTSRLLAAVVLRHIPAPAAILAGLALNGAAAITVLVIDSLPALIAGSAVAGFGLGVVFPTAVAMFCDVAGEEAVRSANVLFASGALGGAVVPLIVSRYADLRTGLRVVAACTVVMIALELVIRARVASKWMNSGRPLLP